MAVLGLVEAMARLYEEGQPASWETATELLARIEAHGTFVPPDIVIRREYRSELLKKYVEYLEGKDR